MGNRLYSLICSFILYRQGQITLTLRLQTIFVRSSFHCQPLLEELLYHLKPGFFSLCGFNFFWHTRGSMAVILCTIHYTLNCKADSGSCCLFMQTQNQPYFCLVAIQRVLLLAVPLYLCLEFTLQVLIHQDTR